MRARGVLCVGFGADIVLRAALRFAWRLLIIRPVNAPLVSARSGDYRGNTASIPTSGGYRTQLAASRTEEPRRISYFRLIYVIFSGFIRMFSPLLGIPHLLRAT
jgi:hypothetical protein